MQTVKRKTNSGYAFECRSDSQKNIVLLEAVSNYITNDFCGSRYITAVDKDGCFVTPMFLRNGELIPTTRDNFESLLKGHTPLVVPLKEVQYVVEVTFNGKQARVDLYVPNTLKKSSSVFADKRGKNNPVLYTKLVSDSTTVGMNTVKLNKDVVNHFKKLIADFFEGNDIDNREAFLRKRVGR